MPRLRSTDLTIAALALVALVVVTIAGVFVSPTESSAGGRGSSYSAAPEGTKGVFLALKALGYAAERSFEPIADIDAAPATSALVLASPIADASEQDRRALRRFVEEGGIVLATGAGGASMLGAKVEHEADALSARQTDTYRPAALSPLTSGAPEITMGIEASASFDAAYLPLFGAEQAPVVRAARLGAGRAIWWAGSTPLTNGGVAERDNFALVLNAVGAPGRLVLWDEYYHGHSRSLWSYARNTPLPWVGLQAALLVLAAAFTFSRRREPIRPPVVDPRTSPMEFVDTLGGLYDRAGAAAAAVGSARERLRRLLVSACGLAPGTSDDRIARAAAARLGLDGAALIDLLARAARESRNLSLRTDDALPVAQELQAAAEMVAAARVGRPVEGRKHT